MRLRRTAQPALHVVAAVLQRGRQVLLTRRQPGTHLAGCWEFPGGKVQPAEPREVALARELDEELGVQVLSARPLIRVVHDYEQLSVDLDVWRVLQFDGDPVGREGQALRWVDLSDLGEVAMPDADRPVLKALRLPGRYTISTPHYEPACFWPALERCLARGDLLQLRLPGLPQTEFVAVARRALAMAREHSAARVLLNAEPALATELGADGVHLSSARLWRTLRRPLPADRLLAASCHDVLDVQRAAALGADFAVLGPVLATRSHPGAVSLGWSGFESIVLASGIPVYALGGVGPEHASRAGRAGAQGIAAISALWDAGE
ncbi:MAG: Nudix family hydrolase [Gammaproteobacteria bacterium]|nr:Nudix family hydrolase [Gammaproteobacteria bacterium]